MPRQYQKGGSIDIVVLMSPDDISIEFFPITQEAEIEQIAKQLNKKNGCNGNRNYHTEIRNVLKAKYPHLTGDKPKDLSRYL